jgi:NAD(P)-dependent dehydrogenase (short-subunit alcohol dehydrogenase family)
MNAERDTTFRLDGRTAVVTGVGPGIGEHVARAFADAGANLVVCARTRGRVEALATDITSGGGQGLAVCCDVGRRDDLERLIAATTECFGTAHIIFHNAFAGPTGHSASSLDLTEDDWRAAFDANMLAPFLLAQAFVPSMRAAGHGSIINVLSTAAFSPIPGIGAMAYGATKSALETLTRYLALECGPQVRANCLCPGTIDAHGQARPVWEPLLPKIPLRRVGRAAEVVGTALYLASDASSYVTGQTIFVDGGRVNAGLGS